LRHLAFQLIDFIGRLLELIFEGTIGRFQTLYFIFDLFDDLFQIRFRQVGNYRVIDAFQVIFRC
jgi:hypothetical protein